MTSISDAVLRNEAVTEPIYEVIRETRGDVYFNAALWRAVAAMLEAAEPILLRDMTARAERAEAALERVRALADDWSVETGRTWVSALASDLLSALDEAGQ